MIKPELKKNTSINQIGIAADHGGFEMKKYLTQMLQEARFEVIDFGDNAFNPTDDYPDYVIPLARAIGNGVILRGIAICASGVGACMIANKNAGVRACLIHEKFSAQQGVEDDNMNMICLGGRVLNHAMAWELCSIFLSSTFSGAERHVRRLAKMKLIENSWKQRT